jgi:hypothetical protein
MMTSPDGGQAWWVGDRIIGHRIEPLAGPKFQIVFLSNPYEITLLLNSANGDCWIFEARDAQAGSWRRMIFDVANMGNHVIEDWEGAPLRPPPVSSPPKR